MNADRSKPPNRPLPLVDPVRPTPRQLAIAAMLIDAKFRPHDGRPVYYLADQRIVPGVKA